MGRRYTITFDQISVVAAQDLFEIAPADDKPVRLLSVDIGNADGETSEALPFTVQRLTATVTSGSSGASVTPTPTDVNDAAAGAACERNNTSRATTSGSRLILHSEGCNILVGFHYKPIPEEVHRCQQGETFIVGLEVAPGASTKFSGTAVFEEV